MQRHPALDRALAYHCAPSLLGIKAADLIACPLTEAAQAALEAYAAVLEGHGICLRVLARRRTRCLLLVYRPGCLRRCLGCPVVAGMLAEAGYPVDGDLEAMLACLSRRLRRQDFPHEIGLFLGYPPADVAGFQQNRGRNYKLCGWWKVYGDAEAAENFFHRCDRCRAALCRAVQRGRSLPELFLAS